MRHKQQPSPHRHKIPSPANTKSSSTATGPSNLLGVWLASTSCGGESGTHLDAIRVFSREIERDFRAFHTNGPVLQHVHHDFWVLLAQPSVKRRNSHGLPTLLLPPLFAARVSVGKNLKHTQPRGGTTCTIYPVRYFFAHGTPDLQVTWKGYRVLKRQVFSPAGDFLNGQGGKSCSLRLSVSPSSLALCALSAAPTTDRSAQKRNELL